MEDIIHEIMELSKKKMIEQGVFTHEAFRQIVDENIFYFLEKGKLDNDDNLEFIKDQVMGTWQWIQDEFAETSKFID